MLSVVTLRVLITAHAALDTMEMEHHAPVNHIIIIITIIIITLLLFYYYYYLTVIIIIIIILFFIIISILIVMAYKSKQIAIDLYSLCVFFPFQTSLNGTPENYFFQMSSYECACTCICMYNL